MTKLLLLLVFPVFLHAQAAYQWIVGSAPGGLGGSCITQDFGYYTAATGSVQCVNNQWTATSVSVIDCKDTTGSTTVYTCPTPTPIPSSYSTGMLVVFVPQTTNTTTTPTLNVWSMGAKNVKASAATNVTVGALVGGTPYLLEYDGTRLVQAGGGGGGVTSVFTRTGAVTATSGDYSVGQVTGAAPLASPTFTGVPAAPTAAQNNNSTQLATTAYTDLAVSNAIAGVNPAVAVQAATAAVLPNSPAYLNGVAGVGATLATATTNTALVVDGYTMTLNDRVLVKNQASAFQNGVYFLSTVQAVGVAWVLTRALDYDQPTDMNNTGAIPVVNGTVNGTTQWLQTSKVVTVGTDAVTFTQFSSNPAVGQERQTDFVFSAGSGALAGSFISCKPQILAVTIKSARLIAQSTSTGGGIVDTATMDVLVESITAWNAGTVGTSIIGGGGVTMTSARSLSPSVGGWTTSVAADSVICVSATFTGGASNQMTFTLDIQ